MKIKYLTLAAMLVPIGCVNTTFVQGGVDRIPETLSPEKGLVIFDSSVLPIDRPMLIIFKNVDRTEAGSLVRPENTIEFTNYPGSVVPFYAPEDPHRIQAYEVSEGTYEISSCGWGRAEINRCALGAQTAKGRLVSAPRFTVRAGEVLNIGRLLLVYERDAKSTHEVIDVQGNESAASLYLNETAPQFVPRLKHSPIELPSS